MTPGGVVGGVVGGVNGLFGADQRPRFREYVWREHIPSYDVGEPVSVGVVLRNEGIEYYEVPAHAQDRTSDRINLRRYRAAAPAIEEMAGAFLLRLNTEYSSSETAQTEAGAPARASAELLQPLSGDW